jgi:hypothetical protein
MVQIQNTDAITAIRDGAKLSISEGFPQQLSNVVVPVLDMTPDNHRKDTVLASLTQTTTGAMTVYTASADRDTYITGASISFVKGATCDIASGAIALGITQLSLARTLISISVLTLTAERDKVFIAFQNPVKIDRGTTITLSGTFTAGALVRSANIIGFEVEANS